MIRLAVVALFLASMAVGLTGCTHTVRGLGADLNSPGMQNYNDRTASDLDY
jgi:predicted small secreted protein